MCVSARTYSMCAGPPSTSASTSPHLEQSNRVAHLHTLPRTHTHTITHTQSHTHTHAVRQQICKGLPQPKLLNGSYQQMFSVEVILLARARKSACALPPPPLSLRISLSPLSLSLALPLLLSLLSRRSLLSLLARSLSLSLSSHSPLLSLSSPYPSASTLPAMARVPAMARCV